MFPDLADLEIDRIVEIADSVTWVRDNTAPDRIWLQKANRENS